MSIEGEADGIGRSGAACHGKLNLERVRWIGSEMERDPHDDMRRRERGDSSSGVTEVIQISQHPYSTGRGQRTDRQVDR